MNKKFYTNNLWLVVGFCLLSVLLFSNAFASDRDRDRGGLHGVVRIGYQGHRYNNVRFYRPSWFGFNLVTILPFGYRTIMHGGVAYYYYNNIYYQACPFGYVVVPRPQALSGETVTINIPNSNGSYTVVTLVKRDNGYLGPQGEYYAGHPTVNQLKALYGN